ncbi:MAG: DUF3552 domain-containing protein, partial [Clostridia bacterium]|nr:DUF3552 domain-containing protein [Clostridia bacterium]
MTSIYAQLLADVSPVVTIIIAIASIIVGGLIGFFTYRYFSINRMKTSKAHADKIIEDAHIEAKTYRKESILETKEEIHKLRAELDKEIATRRSEIQRVEMRLDQREDSLDKKEENLNRRIESVEQGRVALKNREAELDRKQAEIEQSHALVIAELEKVSGMTREEASKVLMDSILEDVKRDAAVMAREIEANAREEAEKRAKNIVGLAIQRCATEYASEITVSTVQLPNEEMKGRIIGRVGRNIRALENATGVDIIIDDTPDVVTISTFEPVRREVARLTVEKLVTDGRIHPARIEEIVDKVRKEIDVQMKEAGEAAVFDTGIYGLHPELVKLLGRLKYRTSYGQNVLTH